MLFSDYFKNWAETYKKNTVTETTYEKYLNAYNHLKKIVPAMELSDLTKQAYQGIINEYALTHEQATTRDFNTLLKSCLTEAVEEEVIKKNPALKVVIRGKKPRPKKIKFLSMFETQVLIKSLELNDQINYDYFVYLLIKTGLRFAEALAVTPADFDFQTQTLNINKTLTYKKKESSGEFAPTKNSSSVRKVQLDMTTFFKFMNLIKDFPKDKPIFLQGRENPYHNSVINDFLKKKCEQAHISVVSAHALRHTHASILFTNGVSIMGVAKRLGHANTTTTQRVYLHIIQELENKDNALTMAAVMNLGN